MHLDPSLALLVGISFAILVIGLVLDYLRQPLVLAYLVAGVVIGPFGFGVVDETSQLGPLGELGIILLMFFVGMEVKPSELMRSWRVAIFGTVLQIGASLGLAWLLGWFLDWPVARSVLMGFVISLSSTAIVVKLLQDAGELNAPVGRNTLGILLVQDLAIVPMLLILAWLGSPDGAHVGPPLWLQVGGGIAVFCFAIWVVRRGTIHLPWAGLVRDHEIETFAALAICFGFALVTALLGLSSVLGAFIAGIVVSTAKETKWFHENLQPFHVLLVAFFFLTIGTMLDLGFLWDNIGQVLVLVVLALATNTFINAGILKLLGEDWPHALFAGALLSQIGEFSFVLAAVGLSSLIISDEGYQLTISVIALTLLASPLWITLVRRRSGYRGPAQAGAAGDVAGDEATGADDLTLRRDPAPHPDAGAEAER
ncbi:MAG TPA: cation:proton antiporter [Pseudomonadales bacterium]|nr:cation:proton antiporter [Pseudomonadales bacterium]